MLKKYNLDILLLLIGLAAFGWLIVTVVHQAQEQCKEGVWAKTLSGYQCVETSK